jgi:hypothetical protein
MARKKETKGAFKISKIDIFEMSGQSRSAAMEQKKAYLSRAGCGV